MPDRDVEPADVPPSRAAESVADAAVRAEVLPAETPNQTMAAFYWVTAAMILFSIMAAATRTVIKLGLPTLEVVFFRNISALVVLIPLFLWRGPELLRAAAPSLYGVRVLVSMISMISWFYAISIITIAEVTAISFLAPLFGTLGAIVVLGEKVRIRRWSALLVGFAGAMIMLRPGGSSFGIGHACALVSALSGGLVSILLKQLTSRDDPDKIVFLTTLMMTPLSLVPALFVWQWPSAQMLPGLVVLAFSAVAGHMCLTRAFRLIDASLVLTFEFSRLPFAVAIGYWMFAEMVDVWTIVGALVIFASAVYVTHREAKLKRARKAAAR